MAFIAGYPAVIWVIVGIVIFGLVITTVPALLIVLDIIMGGFRAK